VPESYEPIDCSFHDRLESWATLRSTTTIRYLDRAGVEVEVRARIADLYTRDGVEYLQTDGGLEIRLDHLVSVDGIEPEGG